jgi:hypothetical protein
VLQQEHLLLPLVVIAAGRAGHPVPVVAPLNPQS